MSAPVAGERPKEKRFAKRKANRFIIARRGTLPHKAGYIVNPVKDKVNMTMLVIFIKNILI